jgi:hypothetical protein
MSEDFLSRWSRRKREAESQAASVRAGEEPQAEHKPPVEAGKPGEPQAPADATLDLLKDLPPIESITAATDIRPFLAPGVPADVARAALRRAWAADPQIRNFVGLAEYDWDFHDPGAMAGFDTLEMTEELKAAVSRLFGPSTEERLETAAVGKTIEQRREIAQECQANAQETSPTTLTARAEQCSEYAPNTIALPASEDIAMQHETYRRNDATPAVDRRAHGRALPK